MISLHAFELKMELINTTKYSERKDLEDELREHMRSLARNEDRVEYQEETAQKMIDSANQIRDNK